MATSDNVVPFSSLRKDAKGPMTPTDPMLGKEFGVERALPFGIWGGDGEVKSEAKVPIEDLVEMRRRDGQARALMRLYVLPILAAMGEGEWVAGDVPKIRKAAKPALPAAAEKPPEADPTADPNADKTTLEPEKEELDPNEPPKPDPGFDDDGEPKPFPEHSDEAVEAAKEQVEKAKEAAEDAMQEEVDFANAMWNAPAEMGGMSTSKMQILKKTLSALVDGFAVFEEVRHVPDDGPLKGKIVLEKLAYRDPRTITFRVDETGSFNGVRQITNKANGQVVDVKIPKEKIWYWACQEEENPFYGISLFESAFYHYEIKRKLYYIAHLAAQFAAVPGRMGEFPQGADPRQINDFKGALANFAFNTAMTMPVGWKVTPFNGSTGFDFIKLIDHHNHMMSKSVMASFIDSDDRAAVIEVNSGSEPSTDFFMLGLDAIMDDIAESWSTKMMPKYIDWNFGSKRYPKFRFGTITDAAKDVIKELFQATVTSSVLNATPEFIREMEKKLAAIMDLSIDYDAIEAQEKQAALDEANAQQAEIDGPPVIDPVTGQEMPKPPPKPPANPDRPNIPGADAPGPGGVGGPQPPAPSPPPGAPPFGKKKKELVAASVVDLDDPSIDELVSMATDLLMETGRNEEGPL